MRWLAAAAWAWGCAPAGSGSGSAATPGAAGDGGGPGAGATAGDPGPRDDGGDDGGTEPVDDTDDTAGDAPWPTPSRTPPGTWVAIAPGTFAMGATPGEACPMSGNDVLHRVTLTHRFEIGATEVTYGAFEEVVGAPHPWASDCDDCPVQLVTWHQAAATCNAMSGYAGLPECYACAGSDADPDCAELGDPYACAGYRLATEAEWEYAAKAGTETSVYSGDLTVCGWNDPVLDPIAWYLYDGEGRTHEVATRAPNAWGLYDTAGNVWEWTHDGYVSDLSRVADTDPVVASPDGLRVMKGGSYNCLPGEVRAAHRSGLPDAISGLNVGLRCARTLGP